MRLKEAVKIIRTIEEQRQALNTIGEVLELAAGIEQKIKELERRRDNLEHEVADQAKKEHEAAVAALEVQHAKDVARLKAELDGLSDRQLAFCRAYADGASGAEAARRAGYSPRSARYQARDLLAKPHIREAIECLHVAVDDMSFEGHVRALALLRDQARASEGDPRTLAAAIRAEVARGRLLGFQPTGRS